MQPTASVTAASGGDAEGISFVLKTRRKNRPNISCMINAFFSEKRWGEKTGWWETPFRSSDLEEQSRG